jgi:hypothetical protein
MTNAGNPTKIDIAVCDNCHSCMVLVAEVNIRL